MARRPVLRWRRSVLAATLALATCVASPTSAGANSFHVTCASSHVRSDDPIVFPGEPGRSHRHEFYGARTARATSTTRSLLRSRTTCEHRADTASYWTPTLEVAGRLRRGTLVAYYRRNGKDRAAAPPIGLRIIAGSMRATSPQPMRVTSWQCTGMGRVRSSRHARVVPRCRAGQQLSGWIRFPDCWNGRNLDSADHRSHMAYARAGRCPATHPVEVMQLVMRVTWPTRPAGAAHVTLGHGMVAPTGLHADFWNAWRPRALQQLRWDCIEVARACGAVGPRRD